MLPFLSALKDMLPFLLTAGVTVLITWFATRWIESPPILLIVRILMATLIYLGLLWLFGAKILRECIVYLLKRKQS